jgi:hypothetical protein
MRRRCPASIERRRRGSREARRPFRSHSRRARHARTDGPSTGRARCRRRLRRRQARIEQHQPARAAPSAQPTFTDSRSRSSVCRSAESPPADNASFIPPRSSQFIVGARATRQLTPEPEVALDMLGHLSARQSAPWAVPTGVAWGNDARSRYAASSAAFAETALAHHMVLYRRGPRHRLGARWGRDRYRPAS